MASLLSLSPPSYPQPFPGLVTLDHQGIIPQTIRKTYIEGHIQPSTFISLTQVLFLFLHFKIYFYLNHKQYYFKFQSHSLSLPYTHGP